MTKSDGLDLVVTEVRSETPLIRSIGLSRPHGEPLPSWQPGAHVDIQLPDGGERSYSLINFKGDPDAGTRPAAYRLGVRLEDASTGGSRFMHGLKPGDRVRVTPPANNFPLEPDHRPVVLVAGGIGVTPIVSMAAALIAERRPFRFYYAGRRQQDLAFLSEIKALCGGNLTIHADDEAGGFFDIRALMASLKDGERVYCCGPLPMIEAAIATAKELGWEQGRLRFELFAAAAPRAGDGGFEVVLKRTGESFQIPPDKSILDVLIEAGKDPLHDCKRGDCGICQVTVLEGVPDHRDYILSDGEKAEGKLMQICVSRSKTPRLVIDL
ncbi:MAG: 2Fe-2S iron-sulfur cluster-binding protein [Pseudolabrys sp.]